MQQRSNLQISRLLQKFKFAMWQLDIMIVDDDDDDDFEWQMIRAVVWLGR